MKLSELASLVFHPAMLRGKPRELVIADLTLDYVSWSEEPVPMLSFEGELLALPLRDWNAAALAAAFGDDARACRGQTVTLSVDSINGYEFVAITPGQRTPARKVPAAKRTRPAKRR